MKKVALVTGGTKGIGKEIALSLGKRGYDVIINYHTDDEAAANVLAQLKEFSPNSVSKKADVSDFKEVGGMVEEIIESFGRIDILVNNAGIVRDSTLKNMSYEQWDEVIKTNLYGVFNCSNAVAKYMMEQGTGKIISIASVVASSGNFGQTNYSASKAGIVGFTKSLALEMAKFNVTVNCISPTFTETDMIKTIPTKYRNKLLEKIPLKRFAHPSEVASLIAYLTSDDADFITGQDIGLNGGSYM